MSSAVLYLDGEYLRYRVTFDNDLLVTITPSAFPGSAGSIVWTQSIRPDEIAQPRDLIQSLGEGIESLR